MVPLPSLPLSFSPFSLSLSLSLFLVIFSDQWRREKNQWSKVITWRKIQRRPEARPATWVPFHASAAATQTHSARLYSHLKQHEQRSALYPLWPIPPQRKLPDCTAAHRHCLPNSWLLICSPTRSGSDSNGPCHISKMPSGKNMPPCLWHHRLMRGGTKSCRVAPVR